MTRPTARKNLSHARIHSFHWLTSSQWLITMSHKTDITFAGCGCPVEDGPHFLTGNKQRHGKNVDATICKKKRRKIVEQKRIRSQRDETQEPRPFQCAQRRCEGERQLDKDWHGKWLLYCELRADAQTFYALIDCELQLAGGSFDRLGSNACCFNYNNNRLDLYITLFYALKALCVEAIIHSHHSQTHGVGGDSMCSHSEDASSNMERSIITICLYLKQSAL